MAQNISPTATAMQGIHRATGQEPVKWRNRLCTAKNSPSTPHSFQPFRRFSYLEM